MPRKQRFKPSRKPKVIPTVQTEDRVELERTSGQYNDMARVSDAPPRTEETEAR